MGANGKRKRLTQVHASAAARCALMLAVAAGVSGHSAAQTATIRQDASAAMKWAKRAEPIVRAVHSFRNDRGLWPQRLKDIVPGFLKALPDGDWDYRWSPDSESTLWHAIGAVRPDAFTRTSYVVYVFGGYDQGWYTGPEGDFQFLNISQSVPPRPERSKRDWAQRVVAELDRRIRREPRAAVHYQAKVSYLWKAEQLKEAKQAGLTWVRAMPKDFNARAGLRCVERKLRSGLEPDEFNDEWSKRPHASLGAWRLFNSPNANTKHANRLPHALLLPFATDETEWYIAEHFAFDLATDAVRWGQYHRAVNYCNVWEAAADKHEGPCDASYLAVRAAAYLALGQTDQARRDAEKLQKRIAAGPLWAANLAELIAAVKSGDTKYKYEPIVGPHFDGDWLIDPH